MAEARSPSTTAGEETVEAVAIAEEEMEAEVVIERLIPIRYIEIFVKK